MVEFPGLQIAWRLIKRFGLLAFSAAIMVLFLAVGIDGIGEWHDGYYMTATEGIAVLWLMLLWWGSAVIGGSLLTERERSDE